MTLPARLAASSFFSICDERRGRLVASAFRRAALIFPTLESTLARHMRAFSAFVDHTAQYAAARRGPLGGKAP